VPVTDLGPLPDLTGADQRAGADLAGPRPCSSHTWTQGTYTVPATTRPLLNAIYGAPGSTAPIYIAGMLLKISDSTFHSGVLLKAEGTTPGAYVVDTATDVGMPGYVDQQLWALAANSAGDLYVGGTSGRAMRRTAAGVLTSFASGATGTLWAAHAPAGGGGAIYGGQDGKLFHVTGPTVTALDRDPADTIFGLAGDGSASGYIAVGKAGKIWRGDGTTAPVTVTSPVTTDLTAIWTVSATERYAVGRGGVILRDNGSGWLALTSGTATDLYGVAVSDDEVYAVGDAGTVLCSGDHGLTWAPVTVSMPVQDLVAVWGRPGRVVIVGRGMQIWYR
jgi:hypothetical protein